jgi:hypothetical protein
METIGFMVINGDLSSTNEDTMILIGNTRPGKLTVCELENHHLMGKSTN